MDLPLEIYSRLDVARTYLHQNWERQVNLPEMARWALLSPYHFHRSFRQAFGMPPGQYFREVKIGKAKELLPGHAVTEVAYATGFSDIHAFSRAFKRATGYSPTDWNLRHARE